MTPQLLPQGRWLAACLLVCLLFAAASGFYRAHTGANNPNLSARQDELVFHAAEIARIDAGGALVSDDTQAAMIPGYHGLLALAPASLRVGLHIALNTLALFLLLLLARTLLPGNPLAAGAAWLAMVIGPYAVSQAAWLNTDGFGRGLFALTLVAAARLREGRGNDLLLAALAAACVLVRSIYLPALAGLFLLALVWAPLGLTRLRAAAALAGVLLAAAPFLYEWRALTPPNLDANEEPGIARSVVVAELFWAGLLMPVIWFARREWSLKPLLPWLGLGVLAVGWTLLAGTWVLVAEDTPTALRSGAMLYMLDRANPPALPLLLVKLAGIGLGASFVGYAVWEGLRQKAQALPAIAGLVAYLLSLWLQPRPYNRYFELFLLLALLYPQRHLLSEKAWRHAPLLGFFAAYAAAFHLFVR